MLTCLTLQQEMPQVIANNKEQCVDVPVHGARKDNKFTCQKDQIITKNNQSSSDPNLPNYTTGIKR